MPDRYKLISVLLLLSFAVMMRFVPHAPNFTPLTAVAVVGGLYLGKRWGIALPVAAVLLSDIVIGFYDWHIMLSVYMAFLLVGLMSWLATKYRSALSVGIALIGSSIAFFLITNAAVWLYSPWYEKNLSGLLYSYELGLPFFRNMLSGDLVYTAILIGMIEVARVLIRVSKPIIWRPALKTVDI